jgi:hypothetical protein
MMTRGNAMDGTYICMPPNSSLQHAPMQVSSGATPTADRLILSPKDHLILSSSGAQRPSDPVGATDPGTELGIDSPAHIAPPSTSDPVLGLSADLTSVSILFLSDMVGSGGAALPRSSAEDLPPGFSTSTLFTVASSSPTTPSVTVVADPVPAFHVIGSAPKVDSQAPGSDIVSLAFASSSMPSQSCGHTRL